MAEGAAEEFGQRGWCRFGFDGAVAAWVERTLPFARIALADPQFAGWWRRGGTWFAGVNALPNDDNGRVPDGPPLAGEAIAFIGSHVMPPPLVWDRAQVSVCFPGYPRHGPEESEAAFRYRRDRDAAHVDGLAREGPARRRHLREPHAFILGLPLTDCPASPLVVWEGSHHIMGQALGDALSPQAPSQWIGADVTEAYVAARSLAFASCRRVPVRARPGEAYLIHRLALHGVSPWEDGIVAPPEGRMIAYFRPPLTTFADWLT